MICLKCRFEYAKDVRQLQEAHALSLADARAAGFAEAIEMAARVADECRAEVAARIEKGKGTWPKPDYVRDEIWCDWQGQRFAAGDLAIRIRALAPAATEEQK